MDMFFMLAQGPRSCGPVSLSFSENWISLWFSVDHDSRLLFEGNGGAHIMKLLRRDTEPCDSSCLVVFVV